LSTVGGPIVASCGLRPEGKYRLVMVNREIDTGLAGIHYRRRHDFDHMLFAAIIPECNFFSGIKAISSIKKGWGQNVGFTKFFLKFKEFYRIIWMLEVNN
jgi:hypothetical protein